MSVKGTISVKGDWGNPAGTGVAKIVCSRLPNEAPDVLQTRMQAFHAALDTAGITATNLGECSVTFGDEVKANKPANDSDIDRVVKVQWYTTTDSTPRTITVPGNLLSDGATEMTDAGERLSMVGRGAMATAIQNLYGLAVDTVVVDWGKVLQKD